MKTLFVGDVHARSEDTGDCESLMELVYKTAKENKVDNIVFLGDQHHNHAIVHVEVIAFWKRTFQKLSKLKVPMRALIGNHDMPGDTGSSSHSMLSYEGLVDTSEGIEGNFLFVNFKHKTDELIQLSQNNPDKILVCHQTFQGAQYENGFYAQDGLEQDKIVNPYIISGHIHLRSTFGRVFYPGSPRWITASDANEDKFIWLIETDGNDIVQKTPISTEEYCSKIVKLEDTEESPLSIKFDNKNRYFVHIKGSQKYIQSRLGKFYGKAKVTTESTDRSIPKLKASEGIEQSMLSALKAYEPKYISKKELEEAIYVRFIKER